MLSIFVSCAMRKDLPKHSLTYSPQKPSGHIRLKLAVDEVKYEPTGSYDDFSDKLLNDLRESGLFDSVARSSASRMDSDILLTIVSTSSMSLNHPWYHHLVPLAPIPVLAYEKATQSKFQIHSESTFSFKLLNTKTSQEISKYEKTLIFDEQREYREDESYNKEWIRKWEAKLCAMTEELMNDLVNDSEKITSAVGKY